LDRPAVKPLVSPSDLDSFVIQDGDQQGQQRWYWYQKIVSKYKKIFYYDIVRKQAFGRLIVGDGRSMVRLAAVVDRKQSGGGEQHYPAL
jgi:hypothetical protein